VAVDLRRHALSRGPADAWGYESDLYPPADGESVPFLHVGHRWYDSATGRFLQRDPIGIAGGPNAYSYVGNLPTTFTDPKGLQWGEGTGYQLVAKGRSRQIDNYQAARRRRRGSGRENIIVRRRSAIARVSAFQ